MPRDTYKFQKLEPSFRRKAQLVVSEMERRGWLIRLVWGLRTQEENDKLYQLKLASKNSQHLSGKALDLVDVRVGYTTNRNHPFYMDLKEISEKEGLVWGGSFRSKWDPCHIEAR